MHEIPPPSKDYPPLLMPEEPPEPILKRVKEGFDEATYVMYQITSGQIFVRGVILLLALQDQHQS